MRRTFITLSVLILSIAASCKSDRFKETGTGITAVVQSKQVTIEFLTPSIVRVNKHLIEAQPEKESLSVVKSPDKNTKVNINEEGDDVILSTKKLTVKMDLATGKISFFKQDGSILSQEKLNGSTFKSFDDAGKDSYMVKQGFVLAKDEVIYGLGQVQNSSLQQRNRTIELKNSNHDITIPYICSLKGYSIFWDNYASTSYSDNESETSFESIGDCIDYYFMYGGSGEGTIQQMRELSGQAPMFPLWTLGYWQSKERYKTQFEVVDVLKKYRELQVPIDGMIQDWRYWGEDSVWNAMKWDSKRYPDPKQFAKEIHDLDAHLMVVAWPGFGPLTDQYGEFESKNMLINFDTWPPNSGTKPYDVYNPKARDIYWDYLNRGVFSEGVDAWWLDSTEPDHINVKPEDFIQPTHLGSYQSVSNAFSLMHTTGIYEHQRQTTSEKRVFILTRSSFAGQQRNAATSWSGDVVSDWNVLHDQIPAALNLSVCGIPYWNSDIGGFFVWNFPGGKDNLAYRELYVRWLQFGTFCPMMRSHGTDTPREIWQFGEKGDWSYDAIKKFIHLRYRLLPYLYSTSWQVTSEGKTFMKPLAFDFEEDKKVFDLEHEYLFGESFLVCPVTESMYTNYEKKDKKYVNACENFNGVKNSTVYLPNGCSWYDFWTGEKINGGQLIEKNTPIDVMPLYVKAGSIVPWGPDVQFAEEKGWDNLEIRIYPGANGKFTLYEDEFDNYNYEKGKYSTIEFVYDDQKREVIIKKRNGTYNGMLKERVFNIMVVSDSNAQGIENGQNSIAVKYTGNEKVVKL